MLPFGPDGYYELPAKWVDSGEPTAREGFVLQAHFDAGTRLRLVKEAHEPSTLGPPMKRKRLASNFYATNSVLILCVLSSVAFTT